jgi:hypothetical protein
MMGNQFAQPSGSVATSTTAKSVVGLITSSTVPAELIGLTFSTDATVTSGQFLVELVQFTTDGTGTGGTPVKYGGTQVANVSTTKTNYTAEPTTSTVLDAFWLPALSMTQLLWPLGRELFIPVSKIVTVRVTAPSGTPNVRATLIWEE